MGFIFVSFLFPLSIFLSSSFTQFQAPPFSPAHLTFTLFLFLFPSPPPRLPSSPTLSATAMKAANAIATVKAIISTLTPSPSCPNPNHHPTPLLSLFLLLPPLTQDLNSSFVTLTIISTLYPSISLPPSCRHLLFPNYVASPLIPTITHPSSFLLPRQHVPTPNPYPHHSPSHPPRPSLLSFLHLFVPSSPSMLMPLHWRTTMVGKSPSLLMLVQR